MNFRLIVPALISAALLLCCVAPDIGWFDTAELIQAAWFYDLTHPPGQPLYVQLSRLLSLLPAGHIPFRINFLSVLCLAVAVALGYHWLRARGTSIYLGLLFIVLATMHPAILAQGVRAEVYTLHILMVMIMVFAMTRYIQPTLDLRISWLLPAFVFGLGLGNHHFLMLLMAPLMLVQFLLIGQEVPSNRDRLRLATVAFVFFVIGLSIYLFLPLRALSDSALWAWGNPDSVERLYHVLRGSAYGVTLNLPGNDLQSLVAAIKAINPFLLGATVIAALWLVRSRRPGALQITFVASLACLAMSVNQFEPHNPDAHGYLAPAVFFMVMLVMYAIGRLPKVWQPLVVVILIVSSTWHWQESQLRLWRASERLPRSMLYDFQLYAPVQSRFIVSSDHLAFPLSYMQNVERSRTDSTIIAAGMWNASWYRDALKRWHPDLGDALVIQREGNPLLAEFPELIESINPMEVPEASTDDEETSSNKDGESEQAEPVIRNIIEPWRLWYADGRYPFANGSRFEEDYFSQPSGVPPRGSTARAIRNQIYLLRAAWEFQFDKPYRAIALLEGVLDLKETKHAPDNTGKEPKPIVTTPLILPLASLPRPVFLSREADLFVQLGLYYLSVGAGKDAEKVFDRAAALGNPNGYIHLASRALSHRSPTRAKRYLNKVDYEWPEKALTYGIVFLRQGELDQAERLFNESIARIPHELTGPLYLARILRSRGRRDEAKQLLSRYLTSEGHRMSDEQIGNYTKLLEAL